MVGGLVMGISVLVELALGAAVVAVGDEGAIVADSGDEIDKVGMDDGRSEMMGGGRRVGVSDMGDCGGGGLIEGCSVPLSLTGRGVRSVLRVGINVLHTLGAPVPTVTIDGAGVGNGVDMGVSVTRDVGLAVSSPLEGASVMGRSMDKRRRRCCCRCCWVVVSGNV
jgi:hypothetical protein